MSAESVWVIPDPVAVGVLPDRVADDDTEAELVVDGRDLKVDGHENGFYLGGCLFDHVTAQMRIYREEIFGPVLTIHVYPEQEYDETLDLFHAHRHG